MATDDKTLTNSSHWGAFRTVSQDGRLIAVKPLETDSDPSPILDALPDMVHSRVRVGQPMIRKGWLDNGPGGAVEGRGVDPFVPVSWDVALDLLSRELLRVRETYGNQAIFSGSYGWSSAGRFHHAKTQLQRFMNLFGGSTVQRNAYSFAAAQVILPHVVGTLEPLLGPVSSWDGVAQNTKVMVCFGGVPLKNAQVQAGGTGAHTTKSWLKACAEAGVSFINISPIRGDLPDWLDAEWIPLRPGSDTAMLLAMAHVVMDEGLLDHGFLADYCVGADRFLAYLRGEEDGVAKTPAWAEAITGVPAGRIAQLARETAASRTMLNMAWGLQRGDHGEQPYWALIAFAAMLGQIGLPGGGFVFGYGAEAGVGNPRTTIPNPTLSAGTNPIDSWIPVARIADMLLEPGGRYAYNGEERVYPETRLVYWCGGNPFHHHQDLGRLARAFRRPDTIVVNECWWTATARHADIVLPATTTLERNDIGASSGDRFLIAMKRAVEPVGEAMDDHAIFSGLAARTGLAEAFTEGRVEEAWLRHLYDISRQGAAASGVTLPDFDTFWESGFVEVPPPSHPHVLFSEFRESPLTSPLNTPSGRIELFSETIASYGYADCAGHPTWYEPCEWLGSATVAQFPLHMISNQPSTRLHSQMDAAGPSLSSKIRGREPIWLNPADAAARGITEGDVVRVWNARGEALAGARLSAGIMPSVVQFHTGAWYDPAAPGEIDRHGNPNVLTLDKGASSLSQAPIAQTCLVEIELWTNPVPPVEAHLPPRIVRGD